MFAEVNVLKMTDHPNIIKLYELYQDDIHYYLITEYYSFIFKQKENDIKKTSKI
jgi:serine/threonine protein kinase